MVRILRTDYAAVNARGVTLYTFSDLAKARAWVRDNAHLHSGLTLESIQLVARRIYKPRASNRECFAIPPMPAVGAF